MIMTGGTSPAARRADPDDPGQSQDELAAVSAVTAAAQAAQSATRDLAGAPTDVLDEALRAISARLDRRTAQVIAANEQDVSTARSQGWPASFVDRLTLSEERLRAMSGQLLALADVPAEPTCRTIRELPGELGLQERRRPVGVIGASFEAPPNVVLDVASQLIKPRNAGVFRTGSSALDTAAVLVDEVVCPAMQHGGLSPHAPHHTRLP